MFIPNLYCTITKSGSTDVYGQTTLGEIFPTKCSVVKLMTRLEKTSVRADSSASRGNAEETTASARLLFSKTTDIREGDKVDVLGQSLRVTVVFPRLDVNGVLNHYQVDADVWA